MTPLERKKKEVELMRVSASKEGMELTIMERIEEIERVRDNIKVQEKKMAELEEELKQL